MSKSKQGTVTSLHQEESRRLRALWDARKERLTQAEFGHIYEIGSQAAVGQFLNGHAAISLKAAKGFARGLGCEISAFSERLAKEAASLGQVSGAQGLIDVMTLGRDELKLLMLYRSIPPTHRSQVLAFGQNLLGSGLATT